MAGLQLPQDNNIQEFVFSVSSVLRFSSGGLIGSIPSALVLFVAPPVILELQASFCTYTETTMGV